MNYAKIYNNLINRSFNRTLKGYIEKHHIVPRCLGGSNKKENIAVLTAREHYIAHLLLVKLHPHESKLVYAAHLMCYGKYKNSQAKNRINNRKYEWLRKKHSEAHSKQQSRKGYKQSEEHKRNAALARTGLKRSEETKQKMSKAQKGKAKSEEHKLAIARANIGKRMSDEVKQKISNTMTGKPKNKTLEKIDARSQAKQ